ncbi:MAG: hypothetical protein AMXMBFR59_12810 [Rhodanobacteraceae bacterium]
MSLIVLAAELVERPMALPPHVLLLGAGASCAAFPQGDAHGRRLPVMSNFVEHVGLLPILRDLAPQLADEPNIEVVYPRLLERPEWTAGARAVEARIRAYFTDMALPPEATIYDRMVLALRPTDSILTFNWDPFIADAWRRNRDVVPLPSIHFLHGCVRVGTCPNHPDESGWLDEHCPQCRTQLSPMPLLYPVEQKDYASDPSIASQWKAARAALSEALTLTVFGYSAPISDVEAVELLKKAWFARSDRQMEHVELIDIATAEALEERWGPFVPTLHYQPQTHFDQSHIARWPRRVSESWFIPMSEGRPCQHFPLPETSNLEELQEYCRSISAFEPQ